MRQYATNQEFADFPTGLDISNLVPSGSSADESASLTRILTEASGIVDMYCQQSLYAEERTDTFREWPDVNGDLLIRARKFPVQSVSALSYTFNPQAGFNTVDTTAVFIDPGIYPQLVRAYGCFGYARAYGKILLKMTYVSGFANMQLTTAANVGDTTLTVDNTYAVNGGDAFIIYDGPNQETVTVDPNGTIGATSIPLSAPLAYTHTVGTRVSSMPESITLSTILVAAYLIKNRRAGASVMMTGSVQPKSVIDQTDMREVQAYLQPFKRVI